MKSQFAKITLLAISCLLSLGFAEVVLRTILPIYEYAASSDSERDNERVWRHQAGARSIKRNPDTRVPHAVLYNSLGLRQHREIDLSTLESQRVVGLFGDSFIENARLPVTQGLGEVLDYLLNEHGAATVLNYGVDGYGIGQSYLAWRESQAPLDLVLYVLCANDFRNLFENAIFTLDETGELEQTPAPPTPLYIRWLSRIHLTYAALDVRNRIRAWGRSPGADVANLVGQARQRQQRDRFHSAGAEAIETRVLESGRNLFVDVDGDDDYSHTMRVFLKILNRWRSGVEDRGGRFLVVGLPRDRESAIMDALAGQVDVFDLNRALARRIEGFDFAQIRFDRDGHWNARGNRIAAEALYVEILASRDIQPLGDSARSDRLDVYYSAFENHVSSATADRAALRAKYLELE